ncbi:hypothetical protein Droror1_Dr00012801 [Drosera rotundifolia]
MKFKDPIEAFPAVQEVLVERMLKSTSFVRLLLLHLRNRDGQHSVLYRGLDLIQLGVLWEPEPAMELPAAPLTGATYPSSPPAPCFYRRLSEVSCHPVPLP